MRKSAVGLAVLLLVVPLAFIAPGCAKKQLVREETAGGPVVEGKKEERKPEITKDAEKSKEKAPQTVEAAPLEIAKEKAKEETKIKLREEPVVEAKPEEKLPPFDLSSLRIQFAFDDSKQITETPNPRGSIKVTNKSKDVLDIQGITLGYLDEAGKPIAFTSGEKIATVSPFWKAVKPGEITEGSLEVTIPRMAVKEKALGKIEINLVYVLSPLKRETLTVSEKVE